MSNIVIPNFTSLRCLQPAPKPTDPQPKGDFVVVVLADGSFLLDQKLLHRAAKYTGARVDKGCLTMLANYDVDKQSFAKTNLDLTWEVRVRSDLNILTTLGNAQKDAIDASDVEGALFLGTDDVAVQLVRRIFSLCQSASVRSLLPKRIPDLTSAAGRIDAVRMVSSRIKNPTVRARIKALGISEADLSQLDQIGQKLHDNRGQKITDKVQARADAGPVQAAKAILLGELILVSHLAHSELPKDRAAAYKVGTLLEGSGRKRRTGTGATGSTGSTGSTPGTGTGTVGVPVHGGTEPAQHHAAHHHGGHKAAPPVVTPPVITPPVITPPVITPPTPPVVTPPVGAVGTSAGAAPGGAGPVAAPGGAGPVAAPAGASPPIPAAAAAPHLPPGTVLATVPGATAGWVMAAVVQQDGGVAWQPMLAPAQPAAEPRRKGRGHHRSGPAPAAGKPQRRRT